MIRLYVDAPLTAGAEIGATEGQAHYLGGVMRRAIGDTVHLFNGTGGEWVCRIAALARGKGSFAVETLVRPQSDEPGPWLVFAVLKRDTTDLVVQKATELGVSALLPVFTERTNAGRVNLDRLRTIATEAAEQSERLTVPAIRPARQLHDVLADWPSDRALYVALERADAQPLGPADGPSGLLIGPEGGFGPRDHTVLDRCRFVRPVTLGPRILRAETAAIAGLALLQAPRCG
ncbi:MAG TPA: 16S rRNA (uracil(1498)-N(3))-methyltransferase [Acetobacteraceae bacterium]|jgi:16S rRNA (uracil1498-N3)-methyltransferase|nr:16S rRNA (uracil(1498)-N(3))-methyltransferase [Acetobacteraceae bacterium]